MKRISLESILLRTNMTRAYKQVTENKGAAGIDSMSCEDLGSYLREHWSTIEQDIRLGNYRPQAVRRVSIPKPTGGVRHLGIPTVLDRMIQQAIAQELNRYYEPLFSDYSYGFRAGKSCHQAIDQGLEYLNEGYEYIVVIDISKFFDKVNHDSLMYSLSQYISDKRVLKLIRKYLQSGIVENGVSRKNQEGTPQGGNLSPVLSNIVLDRLDKELEKRGHRFVRYADDISIYVKSQRAGERILKGLMAWIERVLKLQVNKEKSGVSKYHRPTILGFGFYKTGKGIAARISKQAYSRFKRKLKRMTNRSKTNNHRDRLEMVNRMSVGWLAYFSKADGRKHIKRIDEWLRRRLRCGIWKQWKRVKTRMRGLQRLGIDKEQAYQWANTRKGYWRISNSPILHRAITTKSLKQSGYQSLLEIYNRFHENLSNRRDTRTVCPVV